MKTNDVLTVSVFFCMLLLAIDDWRSTQNCRAQSHCSSVPQKNHAPSRQRNYEEPSHGNTSLEQVEKHKNHWDSGRHN